MEFRLYDRANCSVFDLIGKLEPDQTKGLGLLLSRSEGALKVFIALIGLKIRQYNKYIIDCEPRDVNNKRYDILIRFYNNHSPLEAVLVEAKGIAVSNASRRAIIQLKNYATFQSIQLMGFVKQTLVTLTRDTMITTPTHIKSITWSQLISALYLYAIKHKDDFAYDYVSYLMSIQGNMNYYEEEILSIPAGLSLSAILKSGVYECPQTGRRYSHQRKTLYLAFKSAKGGIMDTLYKLKGIIEGIDLNDNSQIAILENMQGYAGLGHRIADYKTCTGYSQKDHSPKRLFILDMDNSIFLPNRVRPLENNSNWPYYKIRDFLRPVNCNKGLVVVQNNVMIKGNELIINNNGKKKYELYESGGTFIQSFAQNGVYLLNNQLGYYIKVFGVTRGGLRCRISLSYIQNVWELYFHI